MGENNYAGGGTNCTLSIAHGLGENKQKLMGWARFSGAEGTLGGAFDPEGYS